MAGTSDPPRIPLIVGAHHRTGSLTLRDRLFVEDADVPAFLARLRERGIEQAVVLSTCDRVEVLTVSGNTETDTGVLGEVLGTHAGLPVQELSSSLVSLKEAEAVRHLFRVAASLESVVVGEPQILGQLKACHRLARDQGMASGDLESLMQAAYGAAKRVRSETAIGERPVSIAAVAIGIAREVHGQLENATAALLGNGDMGEVIAGELLRAGLGRLTVCDIDTRSGIDVAERLGVPHAGEGALAEMLSAADIVITAAGGRRLVLNADMVRAALKSRRSRPQFIVDAGLPRDVDTAVDRLDDAFLYDLADLERLALEGRANRSFEAEAADRIIAVEVDAFLKGRIERTATPALAALRSHVASLREQVLLEAGNDAERATHMLMQRLLHTPSERLRAMTHANEDIEAAEHLIRELFGITENGENKS
ncbi:MAG: glutamyl-tRNA reductase [Rhodospirillales bacterium]